MNQTLGFSSSLQFSSIRSAALDDPDTALSDLNVVLLPYEPNS